MDWFGRAKIRFTHHKSPLALRQKDGTQTDLLKLCEESTPSCQLNPLLFNGHLQTMWTAVATHGPPIYYKRRIFDADHHTYLGTFAVDFAVPEHQQEDASLPPRTAYFTQEEFAAIGSDDTRPMLIILHGLSGGSHEVYLRHAIAPLINDGGWEACVVNSRGCANSAITSGVLFNARATWDVRQVVKWARATFPNRPLFGLGFSMGANILTNYVGEEGANCAFKAALIVGNPFNLEICSKIMQQTLLGKEVYLRVMGGSTRELLLNHEESFLKYTTKVDLERIRKVKYLYEFDREVQTTTWGYPTECAYYRDASSSDSVLAIRVPFFAITAADDPIAVKEGIPYEEFKQNPYTVCLTTSLGGHLSYFEPGGGRWHARPVCNFFNNLVNGIDLSSIDPSLHEAEQGKRDGQPNFDPMRRKMQIRID